MALSPDALSSHIGQVESKLHGRRLIAFHVVVVEFGHRRVDGLSYRAVRKRTLFKDLPQFEGFDLLLNIVQAISLNHHTVVHQEVISHSFRLHRPSHDRSWHGSFGRVRNGIDWRPERTEDVPVGRLTLRWVRLDSNSW